MNSLIEINEGNKVSARELYKFLGLNQSQFSRWAKSNIENNAFAEKSVDFQGFDIGVEGNKVTDYALTIEFAKKLCMTSKTERGEQARNYFIEVERQLKESTADSYMLGDPIARAKKWIEEEQERQRLASSVKELTPKAKVYDEFVDIDHTIGFRELANELRVSEKELRGMLDDNGWYYKAGHGKRKPYKWVITEGYMKAGDVKSGEWSGVQYRFTMKGRDEVTKMMEVPA